MFSGIIQNQGIVIKKQKRDGQIRMTFKLRKKENLLKAGESIAVEGVCLTAAKVGMQRFEADVVRETLQATTLGNLEVGDSVNLERSLKVGDAISGHFVTGHVDARGQIKKIEKKGRNLIYVIKAPHEILNLIALKGSIALDGISLTIQAVESTVFKIAVIPYTFKETTLGNKKTGDCVNLEIDLITRYLQILSKGIKSNAPSKIRLNRLKRQGF